MDGEEIPLVVIWTVVILSVLVEYLRQILASLYTSAISHMQSAIHPYSHTFEVP